MLFRRTFFISANKESITDDVTGCKCVILVLTNGGKNVCH